MHDGRRLRGKAWPPSGFVRGALRVAAVVAAAAGPAAGADEEETCGTCHGVKGGDAPFVDPAAFVGSIHGKNRCESCHADAVEIPHPAKPGPVACSRCHRVETQIYLQSDHGRAVAAGQAEAAACKDCHGHTHALLNARQDASPVNRRNIPRTCARCHENAALMSRFKLSERHPFESYQETVHGEAFRRGDRNAAVCTDCHGSHDLHGAANSASRIFWRNIPDTCGRCHANVATVYRMSIHGQAAAQGIKEAPVCTSCHGEHTIRPVTDRASLVWRGAVTKTCSGCHASERIVKKFGLPADRLSSYLDTYHGLASQRGDLRVANCASCHGFHDVLPSADARSSVNRVNLPTTCGRCHPGAGKRLATGWVHGPPSLKHWTLKLARWFYLIVIPLTIGGMLVHNLLDLFRKATGPSAAPAGMPRGLRLTAGERVQHAFLLATFGLLAYSGFALKYPDSAWMALLAPFAEGGRRSLHRWSALVFCVLSAYHLWYLFRTARGRTILRQLIPGPGDLREARGRLGYYLGLVSRPPRAHERFHYGEKVEYWSLVWGSTVMVATGGILVFNNLTLRYLEPWIPDLATIVHFYEAILACLAILVWHFYGVIFDPDVYPMNWAWLTGYIRRPAPGRAGARPRRR